MLKSALDKFGADMQEQKSRVDNMITSNPQPSEVQDMRTGREGQTYPVARDMVLGEIGKTEAAQDQINQDTAAQLAYKFVWRNVKVGSYCAVTRKFIRHEWRPVYGRLFAFTKMARMAVNKRWNRRNTSASPASKRN